MDCSPLMEAAPPTLAVRGPGGTNFSIIDTSSSRLTFVDVSNVRRFTYGGLNRSENASTFQCNSGVTGSNIVTLVVNCKWCMHLCDQQKYT